MNLKRLIRDRKAMTAYILKLIKNERKVLKRKVVSAHKYDVNRDFTSAELETGPVQNKSYVSNAVFNALMSRRRDLEKIKEIESLHLDEGKTTVEDILQYFFGKENPEIEKKAYQKKR